MNKKITLFMTCFALVASGIYAQQQNALDFKSGDHVAIANDSALNFGTGSFTLEALIRVPTGAHSNFPTILSKRVGTINTPGMLIFLNNFTTGCIGRLTVQIQGINSMCIGPNLMDNQCHHIAIVRNVDLQTLTAYIDGVRFPVAGNMGDASNNGPIWLGNDPQVTNARFRGLMDEVRIWNVARTEVQIQANMNTSIAVTGGLVAYYRFNQGNAGGTNGVMQLMDATANAFNGTLNNFTRNGTTSNWVASPCTSPCDIFGNTSQDSSCCSGGISRRSVGGARVSQIRYSIVGGSSSGVIQGYSTDCSGASPSSSSLSGTSSGTIQFSTPCDNMQFFSTALQSMSSTGLVTISYVVQFEGGDSCTYTTTVACPRAPKNQCDSISGLPCVCVGVNYFDLNIQNLASPQSDICQIRVRKYNPAGALEPNFWQNANIVAPHSYFGSANDFISVPSGFSFGTTLNMHYSYAPGPLTGHIEVTVVHCNGDTCTEVWKPQVIPTGDLPFTNVKLTKGKSPFTKYYAYTFKVSGPSNSYVGNSPYKVKYITLSIKDTTGNSEITALTGAEMYNENNKWDRLKFSLASHGRHNALLQLQNPLDLKSEDSSGVFQVIFANKLPKDITFNFYGSSGSLLSSGNLDLDTSISLGILQLRNSDQNDDDFMIFNGFPNPTFGQFNIKLHLPKNDIITLRVFDMNGKEVMNSEFESLSNGFTDKLINLSSLKSGNYYIIADSPNNGGFSNTIKVILVK